ncbi:MAG: MATE family efflux transporter [Paracoccaceae bacterium]|nr:MATE family efflux transporter [Paracoccaceae bacterium]
MSWHEHFRATLSLGLPIIGIHMAQMLTHTTDVVMLGWYGVDELAAGVLAAELFFVVYLVGAGFSHAIMPMIANALGAHDRRGVLHAVRMGGWVTVIYALASLPILLMAESLLLALGQQPHLASLAGDYMRIAAWGMLPSLLIAVFKSFLSALRRPAIALVATIVGALANAFCNYLLIFGHWGAPELGIRGAAIASVVTAFLTTALLIISVVKFREFHQYRLFARIWKANGKVLWEVTRLGFPISLTLLSEVGLFSAAKILMGWLGTIPLAAHGIVLQFLALSFMIPLGLSNAGTIRAGFSVGGGDRDGLIRGASAVIVLSMLASLFTVALYVAVPEHLVALFLNSTHAETDQIIAIGVTLFTIAAVFQVADALQVVFLGLLRGLKDTGVPMVIAMLSYWVIGMPVAYLLGFSFGQGAAGIWIGLAIALITAAAALFIRFLSRLSELKRQTLAPDAKLERQIR